MKFHGTKSRFCRIRENMHFLENERNLAYFLDFTWISWNLALFPPNHLFFAPGRYEHPVSTEFHRFGEKSIKLCTFSWNLVKFHENSVISLKLINPAIFSKSPHSMDFHENALHNHQYYLRPSKVFSPGRGKCINENSTFSHTFVEFQWLSVISCFSALKSPRGRPRAGK